MESYVTSRYVDGERLIFEHEYVNILFSYV